MEHEHPLLRVSIIYESQTEKDYIDNTLVPHLTACYYTLDICDTGDYCVINVFSYRHLTHLLMNISIVLQGFIAVDYCQEKGFVVWFAAP